MKVIPRLKLRYPAAAVTAAIFAWAAAPALSSEPYLPRAVDFEQRLGSVLRVAGSAVAKRARAHRGEGPVTFRSAAIEAPKRFDLAGLAGERRGVELRAREAGEQWGPWVETADGNPVWFGGADVLQLRTRGKWRPRGRIHYVNVSGTTSTASTVLTRFRETVNTAFVAAAGVVDPEAVAGPARPTVVTRRQWGAGRAKGGCRPRTSPSKGKVKAAVVHHTVSASDYTAEEAPSVVLGICRYHRNANGWNDIGYNALVDRFGTVYAGRAGGLRKPIIGAHAQGFNAQTTGVASIGTHTRVGLTAVARNALVRYLAWKLSVHRIPARGKTRVVSAGGSASRYPAGRRVRLRRIIGHRDVNHTSCPGDGLYRQLRGIRRRTQKLIADGDGSVPAPEPPPPVTTPPATVPDDGNGGLLPKR